MPGLILFNRRWHVGGDDFVYRGIMEMIFRTAWLIALAVVYGIHKETFICAKGVFLETFYVGMMGITCLNILLTLCIVVISSKGTIADGRPRRLLSIAMYFKLVFGLMTECILLIAGTYWAFGDIATCDDQVILTMKVAVVMGLLVILLFIMSIGLFFDPMGGKVRGDKKNMKSTSTDVWTQRCSKLCCCMESDVTNKSRLTAVARLVADYFTGIDLVPTDIAAGLILVQEDQERRGLDEGYVISPSDIQLDCAVAPVTPGSPCAPIDDWLDINRMIRYLKYAQAAFGWPMYLVLNDCSGPCTLAKHYRCCYRCGENTDMDDRIIGDNCCLCNLAALKLTVGIQECDIIYATYHNKLFEVPFYVAYDHQQKTVVLVSRGLLSLKDTVTSMTMEAERIEFSEMPDDEHQAHKGIMETAKYIKSEVDRLQLLQKAFEEHPDYNLVLTGYSLGAGLSACLALLLHQQYPSLKAYSFACPPVLSPALARYAHTFICSVVFAKDMVPRLSRVNMEDLKVKVLQQIKYSKRPKFKILASGIWHILCGRPNASNDNPETSDLELSNKGQDQSHVSKENITEENKMSWVEEAITKCQRDQDIHQVINVPGKIMRIIEVENNEYRYLLWTKHDDLREIIVTPRMLTDHLPTRMLAAFKFLVETNQTPLDHLPQEHIHS